MWRTTSAAQKRVGDAFYFNPRPPCGGRPRQTTSSPARFGISIHVPRVEDDSTRGRARELGFYFNPRPPCGGRPIVDCINQANATFQSTSPVWRTTSKKTGADKSEFISIHVPRVEDDKNQKGSGTPLPHFNPRPPCGGRRELKEAERRQNELFQSTSPVWRTTQKRNCPPKAKEISIHVPRVEDDLDGRTRDGSRCHFNPRPPCGGRLQHGRRGEDLDYISIHVPRVEDDGRKLSICYKGSNFNPRPPCGGRPQRIYPLQQR